MKTDDDVTASIERLVCNFQTRKRIQRKQQDYIDNVINQLNLSRGFPNSSFNFHSMPCHKVKRRQVLIFPT